MANIISKIFSSVNFGTLTTVMDSEGTIWFIGKEAAEALEYKNVSAALKQRIPDTVTGENGKTVPCKKVIRYSDTDAETQKLIWGGSKSKTNRVLITQQGLMRLIFGSKNKKAAQFTDWVTGVVIPSIAKYGGYIYGQESLENADKEETIAEIKALREEVRAKNEALSISRAKEKKLQTRRHELIAVAKAEKKERIHQQKEAKAQAECADFFMDECLKAQDEMQSLAGRVKYLEGALADLKAGKKDDTDNIITVDGSGFVVSIKKAGE